jgi:hypothetical protein
MTAEKRILISLKDIIAIGGECPLCHAVFSVPIKKVMRLLPQCPNCNEPLAKDVRTHSDPVSERGIITAFLEHLQTLQTQPYGAHIRLEIAGDTAPEVKP